MHILLAAFMDYKGEDKPKLFRADGKQVSEAKGNIENLIGDFAAAGLVLERKKRK